MSEKVTIYLTLEQFVTRYQVIPNFDASDNSRHSLVTKTGLRLDFREEDDRIKDVLRGRDTFRAVWSGILDEVTGKLVFVHGFQSEAFAYLLSGLSPPEWMTVLVFHKEQDIEEFRQAS